MSVVPSGTSTTHYLYPGVPVVNISGVPQPNVAITAKDSTGATLAPRDSNSPFGLVSLSSNASGIVPPCYLPSDGGGVLYSAGTIVSTSIGSAEGITPGQFTTLTGRVTVVEAGTTDTTARSSITAVQGQLGTTPQGTFTTVAARFTSAESSIAAGGKPGIDGAQGPAGPGLLVLAFGAAVPAGTPAGTYIGQYAVDETAAGNATGSVFTLASHGLIANQSIIATAAGPAPIVASTVYYAVTITTSTFQLAATSGGAAITLTASGTLRFNR